MSDAGTSPWIAGADGCPAGWLCVLSRGDAAGASARILPDAAALAALGVGVLGVDMPIGLDETRSRGGRIADRAARAFLARHAPKGLAAGSRVFATPTRPMTRLIGLGYHQANARLPQGGRFSQQSFHITGRIADLDRTLAPDGPVHEVHPEVSFAAMTGRTLPPKNTPLGRRLRQTALADRGFDLEALASGLGRRTGRWGQDDLHDACAALWSARRIARGRHATLPDPVQRDARGHRMAIHY